MLSENFSGRTFGNAFENFFGAFQRDVEDVVIAGQRFLFAALFQILAKFADVDLNAVAELFRQTQQGRRLF